MARINLMLALALTCSTYFGCVPAAHAVAQLTLPPTWYTVVDPYHYDVARPYDAGWNRGADVIASGGVVRALRPGHVRFAGTVAGRHVVTVDATIGGAAVVTTYTDLDTVAVEVGDRITVGAPLGGGSSLHVGAYRADARAAYLPVVVGAQAMASPSSSAGAAAPSRRSPPPTLSGAIARRLQDAIDGATGAIRPKLGSARVGTIDIGAGVRTSKQDRPLASVSTTTTPTRSRTALRATHGTTTSVDGADRDLPANVSSPAPAHGAISNLAIRARGEHRAGNGSSGAASSLAHELVLSAIPATDLGGLESQAPAAVRVPSPQAVVNAASLPVPVRQRAGATQPVRDIDVHDARSRDGGSTAPARRTQRDWRAGALAVPLIVGALLAGACRRRARRRNSDAARMPAACAISPPDAYVLLPRRPEREHQLPPPMPAEEQCDDVATIEESSAFDGVDGYRAPRHPTRHPEHA